MTLDFLKRQFSISVENCDNSARVFTFTGFAFTVGEESWSQGALARFCRENGSEVKT